jgi:hypothetical protein
MERHQEKSATVVSGLLICKGSIFKSLIIAVVTSSILMSSAPDLPPGSRLVYTSLTGPASWKRLGLTNTTMA